MCVCVCVCVYIYICSFYFGDKAGIYLHIIQVLKSPVFLEV